MSWPTIVKKKKKTKSNNSGPPKKKKQKVIIVGHQPHGTWWPTMLYPSFMGSGTGVPEPMKLEYEAGEINLKSLMGLFNYPASYSSFMGSGTSQSTRAHQARVQHSGPPSPVWPTKLIYIYFFSFYILR